MSAPYRQVIVGEWIRVPFRGHTDACCHCGLVHVINYRIVKGTLEMQVARIDQRATAARRRPAQKLRKTIAARAARIAKNIEKQGAE